MVVAECSSPALPWGRRAEAASGRSGSEGKHTTSSCSRCCNLSLAGSGTALHRRTGSFHCSSPGLARTSEQLGATCTLVASGLPESCASCFVQSTQQCIFAQVKWSLDGADGSYTKVRNRPKQFWQRLISKHIPCQTLASTLHCSGGGLLLMRSVATQKGGQSGTES